MFEIILACISLILVIHITASILTFIHLWYVKEYRLDRMWIHIRNVGWSIFFTPFRKPHLSPKTSLLFLTTSTTLAGLFYLLPFNRPFTLVIIDLFTFCVTLFWVILLQIPTAVWHHYEISQANHLLKKYPKLEVIGITGSHGKTSTKEFLSTILNYKFQVLKTELSKNSAVAVAELLLHQLNRKHDLLIAEMAAYKKDEIATIARLVRPQIGIVTAINEQHQDLFSSIQNTMHAKFELIQSLTGKNIAIFSGDNPHTLEMARWASELGKKIWLFSITQTTFPVWVEKVIRATDIQVYPKNLTCKIQLNLESYEMTLPLLGKHQVSNILAAILGAVACRMSLREIMIAVKDIHTFRSTMEPVHGINGAEFIDDTFNNNPDAAMAAIDYLSVLDGRKFLVFQPMIELGVYSKSAHEKVGKYASNVCNQILLTNKFAYEDLIQGAKQDSKNLKFKVISAHEGSVYLKKELKAGDTVLFKGKEAARILKFLINEEV